MDEERLDKLASFQLSMIQHAMKCVFVVLAGRCPLTILPVPKAEKIVYSTCSIHARENEHVVQNAIKSEEARQRGWRLAPRPLVLPSWHRRGLPSELGDPSEYESLSDDD